MKYYVSIMNLNKNYKLEVLRFYKLADMYAAFTNTFCVQLLSQWKKNIFQHFSSYKFYKCDSLNVHV